MRYKNPKVGYGTRGRIGIGHEKPKMKREHTIELVSDGNLAFCTTCKAGEGELTTECCGRQMTEEERHRVYKLGNLDFIGGKWRPK